MRKKHRKPSTLNNLRRSWKIRRSRSRKSKRRRSKSLKNRNWSLKKSRSSRGRKWSLRNKNLSLRNNRLRKRLTRKKLKRLLMKRKPERQQTMRKPKRLQTKRKLRRKLPLSFKTIRRTKLLNLNLKLLKFPQMIQKPKLRMIKRRKANQPSLSSQLLKLCI